MPDFDLARPATCRPICRSACRRSLSSNGPTCARRRRSSTPPAPILALPSPINCRSSASPATWAPRPWASPTCSRRRPACGASPAGSRRRLFDAGTLLHKKRAAAAALEQAAAQYRSTVIKAFQNVADALRALQFDADTLHEQAAAEKAASDSLALARVQYQAGRAQLPDSAERRPHLAAGAAGAGAGGGRAVRRHRRAVPGAGRRLVAPHRRRRRCQRPRPPDAAARRGTAALTETQR